MQFLMVIVNALRTDAISLMLWLWHTIQIHMSILNPHLFHIVIIKIIIKQLFKYVDITYNGVLQRNTRATTTTSAAFFLNHCGKQSIFELNIYHESFEVGLVWYAVNFNILNTSMKLVPQACIEIVKSSISVELDKFLQSTVWFLLLISRTSFRWFVSVD